MEVLYTIQMASKLSGVGVHTIRAWEKRYGAIVPRRDSSGHRAYSKEDVEKLILLSEMCLLGYSISKVSALPIKELKEQLSALGKTEFAQEALNLNLYDTPADSINVDQSLSIIFFALKDYKLDIIIQEVNKLKIILPLKDFALKIILPIMTKLGEAVARGDYSVAHEHALSAILKFHLGQLLFRPVDQHLAKKYTIIFCGIAEDNHEFGIIVGSLLAIHYEFNVIYLGPNLPADALADSIGFLKPQLVVIGATSYVDQLGPSFKSNYVQKVLKKAPEGVKIALGSAQGVEIPAELKKHFLHFKGYEELDDFLNRLKN